MHILLRRGDFLFLIVDLKYVDLLHKTLDVRNKIAVEYTRSKIKGGDEMGEDFIFTDVGREII